ncbi:hypothetical protein GOQ29_13820 [Clostridium sp. D2Q-14]|uniref:hypothetical protein n=1 Tax=Anaeromonas gelatinilytica TaxID=2683194 RepID=UPI00193C5A81|nr:hypothetical protein [Anaeromonas gelatinilytica]MBS4536696.1 hypothetical protein [Anaeromonas gelatinilytica]
MLDSRDLEINEKKKIEIEAFNDCFYYSCIHSALFPVIRYFEGNILSLMSNGTPYYSNFYENGIIKLQTRIKFETEYEELLGNEGIKVAEQRVSQSVISEIINLIKKDMLVILSVDCFYLSNRQDLFHKVHWPHSILIHGFNNITKELYVLDQSNRESIDFHVQKIPYESIKQAHISYCKMKESNESYSNKEFLYFFKKKKSVKLSLETIKQQLMNNREAHRSIVKKGLLDLEKFQLSINKNLKIIKQDNHALELMLDGINDIVKQKKWEKYLFENLYTNDEQVTIKVYQILKAWTFIRNLIAKIMFSNRMTNETQLRLILELEKIVELENEWVQLLTAMNYKK